MAVKHGILGLLKNRSCHGYELQMKFDEVAAAVWPLKAPQLYATLNRLEQGGLVVKERVEQTTRPDRNVYSLTESGKAEFNSWLTAPATAPRTLKDEFFLKATFAMEASPKVAAKLFANQRRALIDLMHQLHAVLQDAGKSGNWRLTLLTKGALYHAEVDLKWLDDFEAALADRRKK